MPIDYYDRNPTPTPIEVDRVALLEPYLTCWTDNGFTSRDEPDGLADPSLTPMVAIDLDKSTFHAHVAWDYMKSRIKDKRGRCTGNKLPDLDIDGEAWWSDGCQCLMVHDLRLLSDDGKLLFVFYDAMNNRKYPQWLGKLDDDHPTTVALLGRMKEFMTRWNT